MYVIDWQVAAYRRAMAANTTHLAKVIRKHRELSGLSDFYSHLHSDWDVFMTQFYDANHQLLNPSSERLNRPVNARRRKSNSGSRQSDRAADTTSTDNAVARSRVMSNWPAVISGVECVSDMSATDANIITTRPQSETSESAPAFSGQTDDAAGPISEISVAEDVTMTTNRRSSRLRSAVPTTVDNDVKPVLDEAVKQAFRSGRRHPAVDESVNADMKPVADGLPIRNSRAGRPNGSVDVLQLDRNTGNSSSAADDCRPRRRKHDVSVASVDADVKPRGDVTAKRRRKCDASRVDGSSETEDIKPVVNATDGSKTKQARLGTGGKTTGTKNTVEVDGNVTGTSLEEQDVKPDLSFLDANLASADSGTKSGDDMREMRRRGRSGKFDVSNENEDINPVINATEGSKTKQARLGTGGKTTGTKNTVEVDGNITRSRLEEQDVKPDLSSLDVNLASVDSGVKPGDGMQVKRRRRRSGKFDAFSYDETIKTVIGTVEKGSRKYRRPHSRRLSANTGGRKNSVEVDGEMSWTRFEKQDVKPDLRSLAAAAVGTVGRRSKRTWSSCSPTAVTRSMYRARQLSIATRQHSTAGRVLPTAARLLSTAADDANPAGSYVSPARCTRSPTFRLLSPSQIKVEVES